MSEALSILFTLSLTAALIAWASRVLFRDYREGFRMLYHWTATPDASLATDVEPRESTRSVITQIAFVGTFVLVAALGFVALLPVFRRLVG